MRSIGDSTGLNRDSPDRPRGRSGACRLACSSPSKSYHARSTRWKPQVVRSIATLPRAQRSNEATFHATFDGLRVDVFVPSIPLYASAERRVREAPLRGRPARYLSAEDLAVFKLLFFRTKDILDVERLVAFGAAGFDRAYVRRWLIDLVGDTDERVARWDRLLADVDSA